MKLIVYRSGIAFNIIIFILYYSIPVLLVNGANVTPSGIMNNLVSGLSVMEIPTIFHDEEENAAGFLQAFLFPISYVGIGMKIARFGLPKAAIGAMLVMWSAQVTVGKLMDGIEAMLLY